MSSEKIETYLNEYSVFSTSSGRNYIFVSFYYRTTKLLVVSCIKNFKQNHNISYKTKDCNALKYIINNIQFQSYRVSTSGELFGVYE